MKILLIIAAVFFPHLALASDLSSDEKILGRCGYVVQKGLRPPQTKFFFVWNKTKNTIDLIRFESDERIAKEFKQTVQASIEDEMFLVFEYAFKNFKKNGKADKFDEIIHRHEIDILSGASVKFEELFINTKNNKQKKRYSPLFIKCKLGS